MTRAIYALALSVRESGKGWRNTQIDRDEEDGRFARAVQLALTLADKIVEACNAPYQVHGAREPYNPHPDWAEKEVRVTRTVVFTGDYESVRQQVENSLRSGGVHHRNGVDIVITMAEMEEVC